MTPCFVHPDRRGVLGLTFSSETAFESWGVIGIGSADGSVLLVVMLEKLRWGRNGVMRIEGADRVKRQICNDELQEFVKQSEVAEFCFGQVVCDKQIMAYMML